MSSATAYYHGPSESLSLGGISAGILNNQIMRAFRDRITAINGEDIALAFLIGARARPNPSCDAPYDVALFFRDNEDSEMRQLRVDDLCSDMLMYYSSTFNILSFSLSDFETKESLRRSLTKSGLCLIENTHGVFTNIAVLHKIEKVLSCKRIVCLNSYVTENKESNYETYLLSLADVLTEESRTWTFVLSRQEAQKTTAPLLSTTDNENDEYWPRVNITPDIEKTNSDPAKNVAALTEIKAFIGSAKILTDDINAARTCLKTILRAIKIEGGYICPESFHDAAWELACAFSSQPEALLCKTESSVPDLSSRVAGPEAAARRNAELLRLIAGITLPESTPASIQTVNTQCVIAYVNATNK